MAQSDLPASMPAYQNLNIACNLMNNIIIYSSLICPYCHAAKRLLQNKGLEYTEIRVDLDPQQRQIMREKSGRTSVPQIFINNHHVGGFDDLNALNRSGKLDQILLG